MRHHIFDLILPCLFLIQVASTRHSSLTDYSRSRSVENRQVDLKETKSFRELQSDPVCSSHKMKQAVEASIHKIQDIIGTDAGDRGMKSLIVPGDLLKASEILGELPPSSWILVLSGFPCCVNESPPTETDGPPGTVAIARAGLALGHKVTIVTDTCNEAVFRAAMQGSQADLQVFSSTLDDKDEARLVQMASDCNLIIACERAGPAKDGNCYTMRGINMTERGLIAPLDRLVADRKVPFLAIGDGGNEMGMGKVISNIVSNPKIANGDKIGCVTAADHLIAASVSNWGGYALAAGASLVKARRQAETSNADELKSWVEKCVPTEQDEIELLDRCVAAGCRDGVSGKVEATVDGMPLETSLKCLRDIREVALSTKLN